MQKRTQKHKVTFELPGIEIGNADLRFVVQKDGKQLGKIEISRGQLEYFPGRATTNPIKVSWTKFHELMKEQEK